jgi:hypothetical protein
VNARFAFSHTGKYLLQNIRFGANIRKTLSGFHFQANIHLQVVIILQRDYDDAAGLFNGPAQLWLIAP